MFVNNRWRTSRIRIRYDGYGPEYPDPYKNLTDPEHWFFVLGVLSCRNINQSNIFTVPQQKALSIEVHRCYYRDGHHTEYGI
jgi:hypothetical protein